MINKMDLVKELRALTQAGMSDCKSALEECEWDLQKAIDAVKAKGLNNTTRSAGKTAAEGRLILAGNKDDSVTMVEVNCQTDFVANSPGFKDFVTAVGTAFAKADLFAGPEPVLASLEDARKEVMASTKENVVVRRWFRLEAAPSVGVVSSYLHSNAKVGVLVSLTTAPGVLDQHADAVLAMGEELAMQVAAMSPVAVSRNDLPVEEVERQRGIFETQLTEAKKPQTAWPKIMEGKFNKWYTDVCLLDQESVVTPKTSIAQVLKNLSAQVGGEVTVLQFVRASVGDGVEVKTENYADEISKMTGIVAELGDA